MIVDDDGKRLFVCSDTDYCQERQQERQADKT
jgi:alpha-D-ribose 1-methylphosphonate 5-phosphate C-P lyase